MEDYPLTTTQSKMWLSLNLGYIPKGRTDALKYLIREKKIYAGTFPYLAMGKYKRWKFIHFMQDGRTCQSATLYMAQCTAEESLLSSVLEDLTHVNKKQEICNF